MASFDSSPSEADRMAQGACDGVETTGLDYVSSGGFNGTGPDSARHYRVCKTDFRQTPLVLGPSLVLAALDPMATPSQGDTPGLGHGQNGQHDPVGQHKHKSYRSPALSPCQQQPAPHSSKVISTTISTHTSA